MQRPPAWQLRLVGLVVPCLLMLATAARAQHPRFIEPYEVLYGKPQLLARALTPDKMTPATTTLALVQARTETMLARLVTLTPPATSVSWSPKLQRWAASVKKHRSEAELLRDRGKHYAAWWRASLDYIDAEYLVGLTEALARESRPELRDGSSPATRLLEIRARLDAFRTRLEVVRVNSVSVALAISEGYSTWVEASSLLELLQSRPAELADVLEPLGLNLSEAKRDLFLRVFMEPVMIPVIQWAIEEAELGLQASQADLVTMVRPDEASIHAIARAYADAARANLTLAQAQRQGRQLPERSPEREFAGRLTGDVMGQALTFEHQHRDDAGMQSGLLMLGTSRAAYAHSLAELVETQVQLDPAVAAAPDRASAEKEMDRLRGLRLVELEQRDREAAAQAQVVLGQVPALVGLSYARAQELADGNADDRELALSEILEARTFAELAAGLGAPPPAGAVPIDDRLVDSPNDFIQVCIGRLKFSMEGPARSLLDKKSIQLTPEEFHDLFLGAIVKTCTSARDLTSSAPRSLFFEVFINDVMTWFREVKVAERGRPSLTDICRQEPRPDQELLERQSCSLTQRAMSLLSDNERQLLDWHVIKEQSYQEIADRLKISLPAATKRCQRALEALRTAYKRLDPLTLRWPGPAGRARHAVAWAALSALRPAQSPWQSRTLPN